MPRPLHSAALAAACSLLLSACGKEPAEEKPIVPVRVAPAIKGSIRQIVTADAILYPRDQANIVPKISAPIRRFLVNRGAHVKRGQLVAELENRDLVAGAVASKGQFGQAESNYRATTAVTVPEAVTKATADADAAKQALDAAQKLLESRQQLLAQGALARKSVDEAQVAFAQARAAWDTAQQHLQALQSVGRDEQVRTAAAQVEAARGQYESAQAQVAFSQIRSPIDGVVTDRPLYPGDMAAAGTPLMTIMDLSRVVARINMAQEQARDVKAGDDREPRGRSEQHDGAGVGRSAEPGRSDARGDLGARRDRGRHDRRRRPGAGVGAAARRGGRLDRRVGGRQGSGAPEEDRGRRA